MKRIIMLLVVLVMSATSFADTVGERNNNPGNVKKPGNDVWVGTIGYDDRGHVIFKDLDHGVRALYINFRTRVRRCPEMTLGHYFNNVYAEANGFNEARKIAQDQGISTDTKLKDVNITKMVISVATFESRMTLKESYVNSVVRAFDL